MGSGFSVPVYGIHKTPAFRRRIALHVNALSRLWASGMKAGFLLPSGDHVFLFDAPLPNPPPEGEGDNRFSPGPCRADRTNPPPEGEGVDRPDGRSIRLSAVTRSHRLWPVAYSLVGQAEIHVQVGADAGGCQAETYCRYSMGNEALSEDGFAAGSRSARDLRGMNPDRATAKQKCGRSWTLPIRHTVPPNLPGRVAVVSMLESVYSGGEQLCREPAWPLLR